MKKVIVVATIGLEHVALATARLHTLASQQNAEIVFINQDTDNIKEITNNIEAKNVINSAFEREPIQIYNFHKKWTEPKIYNDVPRNKFIDKPRHNFRKR